MEGTRSIGDFMSFFTALALAFQPMRRLGGLAGAWQTAAASLERVYQVIDTKPRILSGGRVQPPSDSSVAETGALAPALPPAPPPPSGPPAAIRTNAHRHARPHAPLDGGANQPRLPAQDGDAV